MSMPHIPADPERHVAINAAVVAAEMQHKAYADLMRAAAIVGDGVAVAEMQGHATTAYARWLDAVATQCAYQAAEARRSLKGGG